MKNTTNILPTQNPGSYKVPGNINRNGSWITRSKELKKRFPNMTDFELEHEKGVIERRSFVIDFVIVCNQAIA